ncbi:MAG: hypothetical protein RMJ28_06615 [Nitrososphaerota archaeon]|nr:hypothetical protein [Nitrososphaerota archaeon]
MPSVKVVVEDVVTQLVVVVVVVVVVVTTLKVWANPERLNVRSTITASARASAFPPRLTPLSMN